MALKPTYQSECEICEKNDSQTAYVTADLSPVRRSRMIMEAEFSLPSLRDWITTTTTRTIEIIQLHQQQSESPPALHDKKSRIFAVIDSLNAPSGDDFYCAQSGRRCLVLNGGKHRTSHSSENLWHKIGATGL